MDHVPHLVVLSWLTNEVICIMTFSILFLFYLFWFCVFLLVKTCFVPERFECIEHFLWLQVDLSLS